MYGSKQPAYFLFEIRDCELEVLFTKGEDMYRNKWAACSLAGLMLVICLLFASCSSTTTTPATTTSTSSNPAATTSSTTTTSAPTLTPQLGGKLNIIASSVPLLMPIPVIPAPAAFYFMPVLEPLIGQDKNGPAPTKLATSWDYNADGTSLTLHLRQGVTYQDGTAFDAAAVKFNLDMELGFRPEVASVASIDVVDDYTVRLNLKQYDNTLLQHLSWVAGMTQSPTAIQTHEKDWFSSHAVGTGPFMLTSFDPPNSMVFEKYDGYWDAPKPYLDELRYTFVIDPVTAELSFRAGDAQVWDQMTSTNLKAIANLDYNVNSSPRTVWVALGDSANPESPFAKLEVRQALDYAIDKASIANVYGNNVWEAPSQCAASSQFGYIPDFQGRAYDPAKAKQLLADAGYPDGFKTTLIVRNNIDINVVGVFQANLAAIGIDADIIPADTGAYRAMLSTGWDGIIVNGLGVAGSVAKMMQTDAPNANWCVSALVTDNFKNALAAATSADTASELEANQALVKAIFDDAIMVPWVIDSTSCAYVDSVHTDLDVVSLQWWNPGDTWMSQN